MMNKSNIIKEIFDSNGLELSQQQFKMALALIRPEDTIEEIKRVANTIVKYNRSVA